MPDQISFCRKHNMVTYTGINHLAMVTGNMDETIRFWRDLLGMRLVAGLGSSKYRQYFFEISEYDMIAFFEWQDVEKIKEGPEPQAGQWPEPQHITPNEDRIVYPGEGMIFVQE